MNSVLAQRGVEPTILVAANGAVDAGVIHRLARPTRRQREQLAEYLK